MKKLLTVLIVSVLTVFSVGSANAQVLSCLSTGSNDNNPVKREIFILNFGSPNKSIIRLQEVVAKISSLVEV